MDSLTLNVGKSLLDLVPIPGLDLVSDTIESLFSSSELSKDKSLGIQRINEFVKKYNITNKEWINKALLFSEQYSGTKNYWPGWQSLQEEYFNNYSTNSNNYQQQLKDVSNMSKPISNTFFIISAFAILTLFLLNK